MTVSFKALMDHLRAWSARPSQNVPDKVQEELEKIRAELDSIKGFFVRMEVTDSMGQPVRFIGGYLPTDEECGGNSVIFPQRLHPKPSKESFGENMGTEPRLTATVIIILRAPKPVVVRMDTEQVGVLFEGESKRYDQCWVRVMSGRPAMKKEKRPFIRPTVKTKERGNADRTPTFPHDPIHPALPHETGARYNLATVSATSLA